MNDEDKLIDIHSIVWTVLFSALMSIGGFIAVPIPISPVPIILTDMFVMLSGLMLGKKQAFLSVVFYIFLGVIGLPVFAGGKSGISAFLSPSGGFLIGYIFLSFIISLINGSSNRTVLSYKRAFIALFIGNIFLYLCGIVGIVLVLSVDIIKAFYLAVLPYLPGTVIKSVLSTFVYGGYLKYK